MIDTRLRSLGRPQTGHEPAEGDCLDKLAMALLAERDRLCAICRDQLEEAKRASDQQKIRSLMTALNELRLENVLDNIVPACHECFAKLSRRGNV